MGDPSAKANDASVARVQGSTPQSVGLMDPRRATEISSTHALPSRVESPRLALPRRAHDTRLGSSGYRGVLAHFEGAGPPEVPQAPVEAVLTPARAA